VYRVYLNTKQYIFYSDLESKFGHLFTPLEKLPLPPRYMGRDKAYPSKSSKFFCADFYVLW